MDEQVKFYLANTKYYYAKISKSIYFPEKRAGFYNKA